MANYVVTTVVDEDDVGATAGTPLGTGLSLREAITLANLTAGADTITFANGMGEAFEGGGTIYLTQGTQLQIDDDVAIDGDLDDDGTPDVTVNANSMMGADDATSRVIQITSGTTGIDGLTITGGEAFDGAGILVSSGATLHLTNSTLTDNNASAYGGGLYNNGTATLTDSTVSGNSTTYGGGIYSRGALTLTNSTVSGNTANLGGGLYLNGATAVLTNTTVANNSAYRGGGLYTNGNLTLTNVTVSGNYAADYGGGFYVNGGSADFYNSIVLGNSGASGGSDLNVSLASYALNNSIVGGYSMYVAPAAVFDAIDGSSPSGTGGLLADNGGPVMTIALLLNPANPALDAGDDSLDPATDARGEARVDFPGVANNGANISDLGAFELVSEAPSLVVTTTADVVDPFDGETSLREAIAFANDPTAGDMADGDADNDGFANDTITFASAMGEAFENGGTITLEMALGQLEATAELTIDGDVDGDGTPDVTVDADGNSRILETSVDTTLRGLVLTGGHTTGSTETGGGVRATGGAALTIEDSTVSGNSTAGYFADGGGIYSYSGSVTLTNSTVSGNSTTGTSGDGGGIYSYSGNVALTGSTVSGNSTAGDSADGGGIYSYTGDVTLTDSTVSGNYTTGVGGDGGGIYSYTGNVTLTDSTVSGNSTVGDAADGGGIYSLRGNVTLTGSTVSGNSTDGSAADGGGIYASFGNMTLTNSTVSGNSTTGGGADGGGIYSRLGSVTLTNSTVSGNSTAGTYADGGGIYNSSGALTLTNSTVSGNSAAGGSGEGGGIYNRSGTVTLTNSIVLGNSATLAAPEIQGGYTPVGPNIVGGTPGDVFAAIDGMTGGGLLASNGGPVQTIALKADPANPALDAGDDTLDPDMDARGLARFDAPGVANNGANISDLGAYELQIAESLVVTTTDDVVDLLDGETSLREAIMLANATAGPDTITFAHGAGEAFESGGTIVLDMALGQLEATDEVTIDGDVDGDGTPDVTIDADGHSRILDTSADTTLRGLVLTGGHTTGLVEHGGGVRVSGSAALTIEGSTVSGNSTAGSDADGGGIYSSLGAVTLTNSTVSGNSTVQVNSQGGGIFSYSGGVTLTNTTVSGNSTAGGNSRGGGIYSYTGGVTLTNSTVSGNNTAGSLARGGGIYSYSGGVTLTNTTVSGNSTTGSYSYGGGIYSYSGGVTLTNSTVSGNRTAGNSAVGGGVFSAADNITLTNSIVLGNVTSKSGVGDDETSGTVSEIGPNIIGPGDAAASDVFAATAEVIDGNSMATGVFAGVLADNGGPVQTIALLGDDMNPALDAGDDTLDPDTDARGEARYDVPGAANNGANISDLGAFELVPETPSLIVTTTADVFDMYDGETSLREAIAFANDPTAGDMADGDADNDGMSNDTITFADGMGEAFETGGTIYLTQGTQLTLSSDITVDGDLDDDGTPDVTVDADSAFGMDNATSRVMRITEGTTYIDGLTITGGDTNDGAGIFVDSGATLHLTSSALTDNNATIYGGGIYNNGTTTLTDSTVSGNTATYGGGIYNHGPLTMTNSTVSGNTASYGGGVFLTGAAAVLTNVTIANNSGLLGAGICNFGAGLTLTNVTVSGNYASLYGGGVYANGGSTDISNSIILGNDADNGAPDLYVASGSYTLTNSIVGGYGMVVVAPTTVFDAIDGSSPSGTGGLLADNGGPVQTIALLVDPSNPALDVTDETGVPTTDARGVARYDQAGTGNDGANFADLGAFEAQEARSLVVTTDMDVVDPTDGLTSLREAIAFANDALAGGMADGDADNDGFANDTITFAHGMGEAFEMGGTITLDMALGQLEATAELTIDGDVDGDGAPDVTVDADGNSRVLDTSADTTLRGLVLTGGHTTNPAGDGGGIRASGTADLLIEDSVVSGNSTAGDGADGGGIASFGGAVTLTNSTVSGNSTGGATSSGGGVFSLSGTVTLTGSTVSGNSTVGFGSSGGGIFSNFGAVTLTDSTVSGNSTLEAYAGGGGIYTSSGNVMLVNSTVSGNSTAMNGAGGGGINSYSGDVTLTNSTVSGNSTAGSSAEGGGIYTFGGTVTLTNSIVLGNVTNYSGLGDDEIGGVVSEVGPNILGPGDAAASNVFAATAEVIDGNSMATGVYAGVLAGNGGPVWTIALLADGMNPALDASDPSAPATDARGAPRLDIASVGNDGSDFADLGAFELQAANSLIVTTTADVVDPFDGETSLREAILFANAVDDADGDGFANDTITFAHGMGDAFETGGTITLDMALGQLDITEELTIDGDVDGDGTPDVTIDADGNSRIFDTSADTTLRGLVLTGGHTTENLDRGGAVRATGSAALTIEDSTVSGNSTAGNGAYGGGIASFSGDLTLTNSTVSGNSTAGVGGRGGGIFSFDGAVTLTGSTVSGNSTAGDFGIGGGIYSRTGDITLTDSAVSTNSTAGKFGRGGGIYSHDGGVTLTNSTVSGNSTVGYAAKGGGIFNYFDSVTLTNSTVSGNSTVGNAAEGGGIYAYSGTVTLTNSIVLGNVTSYSGLGDDETSGTVSEVGPNIIGPGDAAAAEVFASTYEVVDGNSMATGVFAGVLANNGGPVQTIALLSDENNPALDAGDDTLDPDTDARGLPRFDLPGIANNGANISDLGAFEIQTEVNITPTAPASNSIVVNEDTSSGLVDIGASDANGDMLAYSLKPGFEPAMGSVSFVNGKFIYLPDMDVSGADAFTILIDDGNGGMTEQAVTVTILPVNDDPVAATDIVVTPEDTAVMFDVLANDTDVDGGAPSVTSHTLPANGTLADNGGGSFTYTPDADYFGPDGFDYDISDGNGGAATGHVTITVLPVNDPPTAPAMNMVETDEDTPSAPVPIGATDPESTIFSYSIPTSAQPGLGSVSFIGDSFIYTPDPDANGMDHFDIIITDEDFASVRQEVWVTINPVNDDPVANDDALTTDQDMPIEIPAADLLANDSDVDGDTLTVTGVSGAVNGIAGLVGSTVAFIPDPGFFGVAGFDYTISDGNGGTDTAHVTVNVIEDSNQSEVTPDALILATIENASLAFAVTPVDSYDDPITFTPGTPANGMLLDDGNGSFLYTPNPGFFGFDLFNVTVANGDGGMYDQPVTVKVKDIPDGFDWRLLAGDGWAGAVGGTGQVIGTGGFQSVKVLDLPGTVSFDPSFNGGEDFVCLIGNAADWSIVRSGSTAILFDGDTCVVIPVGSEGMLVGFDDGNRTLAYDEVAGSMRIGDQLFAETLVQVTAPAQGFDVPLLEDADALARLYLAEGGSAAAGGHLDVIGTNGAEELTLLFGDVSLGASFNIGNDMLILDQPTGDFTAARSGSLALFDSATTDVSIPVGSAGMDIAFANTTATLAYDAMADAVFIGTQMIDTTPMPLTFA